ncbi:MAG: DUF1439 domain-containing protein [Ramlibacter sp.]
MKRNLLPLLLAAATASVQAEWLTQLGDRRDANLNTVQGAPASLTGAVAPSPSHAISAAQVRRAIQQRFPVRRDVRGVVELELQMPRLRFLASQNRLGAELPVTASGPALRRPHTGQVDLDFALRYEPSDKSVRAHQVRVSAVRVEGLSADAQALLDLYVRRYAEQTLQEFVVHRLRPEDLALPDAMGLEPGSISVGADGLLIGFAPKGTR